MTKTSAWRIELVKPPITDGKSYPHTITMGFLSDTLEGAIEEAKFAYPDCSLNSVHKVMAVVVTPTAVDSSS